MSIGSYNQNALALTCTGIIPKIRQLSNRKRNGTEGVAASHWHILGCCQEENLGDSLRCIKMLANALLVLSYEQSSKAAAPLARRCYNFGRVSKGTHVTAVQVGRCCACL